MEESDTPQRTPAKRPSEVFSLVIRPMGMLAISELAIGAVYLYDCPRQPYIPIYLLVMGVFSLLPSVLAIVPPTANAVNHSNYWSGLVSLFLFCWFITGNVWIYSIYEPNYNKTTTSVDPYCNKTLYLFAFWTTNLTYILFALCPVIIICCCCPFLMCCD